MKQRSTKLKQRKKKKSKVFLLAILLLLSHSLKAQNEFSNDTITSGNKIESTIEVEKLSYKQFILPTLFVAYGTIALGNENLIDLNKEVREKVYYENKHGFITIDNYTLFAPAALAFGLQAFGVKGKNNFKDEVLIYTLSIGVAVSVFLPIKYLSNEMRPDNTNSHSFPSGHTAIAFASAEFLRREYKDVSQWYGIGGYVIATGTGFLRIYNNRHWLSDVVAGAGIGIASTTIAYWLYDVIKPKYKKAPSVYFYPILRQGHTGLGLVGSF